MKTKKYFSTNQTRKNVVGKSCFTLPLSPLPACLSLSLLFVSTCVGRVTRPHSHLRVGRGFIYLSEEASPGGRGRFIYLFIGAPSAGGHDIEWRQAPERCVLAAARSEQPLFGWRAPCLGRTRLGSSSRRTPGLRKDQRGPVQRWHTMICVDNLRSPNSGFF